MWGYIIGGATIFALIVGFFAVYNGRATRKLILAEERRAQEILERHGKILEKLGEQHNTMLEKLSEQHNAMIEILKTLHRRSNDTKAQRDT